MLSVPTLIPLLLTFQYFCVDLLLSCLQMGRLGESSDCYQLLGHRGWELS